MNYAGSGLSVIVPWRPDDLPEPTLPPGHRLIRDGIPREIIWRWVKARYQTLLPLAEIVEGDTAGDFNRAAARNDAAQRASRDLLLIADADVIPNVDQITRAVDQIGRGAEGITDSAQWVLPYRRYIQLLPEDSAHIVAAPCDVDVPIPQRVGWNTDTGSAGLMVITREAFDEVKGYDPRHVLWGSEDSNFTRALETIHHGAVRTDGAALHLHHPRPPNRKQGLVDNSWLTAQYEAAHYDPDAMLALIAERGTEHG